MQKVDTDGLNPTESPQGRQSISAPLDAEEYSMNYYVLDPGEEFSGSRHAHMDQEESFFVLEGEATFETSPTRPSARSHWGLHRNQPTSGPRSRVSSAGTATT